MFAQQHQHPPNQPVPVSAPILSGLGDTRHVISTSNPEGQRYFNQGLSLIYGFNHEEAARSFQRAAELDPACAMAYWGIALAIGPNYNNPEIDINRQKAAFKAIQHALALSGKAPASEQAYIRALAKRHSNDLKADRKQLGVAYSRAMLELMRQYPDDLDAATLYAESAMDLRPWELWTADGEPAYGTLEILDVLRSVLRRNPAHLGANHYYIHATEASPHPERALASAQRLKTLAPAAGHLLHMPSHVYMRTGDYHAASVANQRAAAADRTYIDRNHVTGIYPAMYYTHNLDFLSASASMEGRFADADTAARELVERASTYVAQMPMDEWFLPTRLFVLIRFRKWNEIAGSPEPQRKLHLAHAAWRFARGMSFAGTKDLRTAATERDAFAKEVESIPPYVPFGFNTARELFDIAGKMLDASIARARGDFKGAANVLQAAAKLEDRLNYDGPPPDWYLPVRESLGSVLFSAGRFPDAEAAFREDLRHHARNPRSLFGLAECLQKQRQTAEAVRVRREFASAWKNADVKLRIEDL